ncbi:MAG: branched-chain amino acid ABC transporter permease [Candidatus Nezhaarchaeales archaeon]
MIDVVIGGAILGAIFSLIAIGLNLQYGVTRILNVAHGEFLMLGAYITNFFFINYGINPLLCIAISGPLVFVIGFIIQNIVFRRIILISRVAEELEFRSLLACFGLMYIIQNVIREIFGSLPMSNSYLMESILILGERFQLNMIVSAIMAVIISALLYVMLRFTKVGLAMRAVVEEPIGAQLVGINTLRTHSLSFSLGALLAAIAGIMISMIYTNLTPYVGPQYTFIALAIIVLGGMGSFVGSLVGGFIIGYIYYSTLKIEPLLVMAIVYVFLILFLIFKPRGLFGR